VLPNEVYVRRAGARCGTRRSLELLSAFPESCSGVQCRRTAENLGGQASRPRLAQMVVLEVVFERQEPWAQLQLTPSFFSPSLQTRLTVMLSHFIVL